MLGKAFSVAVDPSGVVYVGSQDKEDNDAHVTVYASGASGDAAPIRTLAEFALSFKGIALNKPRNPLPSSVPQVGQVLGQVATLFGGVAVDGGGLVFVGGVPIPVGPWGELSPGM